MTRREKQLCVDLKNFHVSEACGFALPDPLDSTTWLEIANNLTGLIERHQLRQEVNQMELLSTQFLDGHKQLRLAHLALSFITMGYVWQEGEGNTEKVLPRNLAVPFCQVSEILGLPPILVHADCVLANWKKIDPDGNLDTIFALPGGESLKGFFLVTLLVEIAAVQGIKAVSVAAEAVSSHDDDCLQIALRDLTKSIKNMKRALKEMDAHVDPATFYGIVRLFLSGWKDNPVIPDGLLYEGVAETPKQFSGGSAAQSSTLHCFDEFLGIRHDKESAAFLQRMRDYMPPSHKALIQTIASGPSVPEYVVSRGGGVLRESYNTCVAALVGLRNHHIVVVTRYVSITAAKAKAEKAKQTSSTHILRKAPASLEERGTGGSAIMCFLKNVRDTTKRALIDI